MHTRTHANKQRTQQSHCPFITQTHDNKKQTHQHTHTLTNKNTNTQTHKHTNNPTSHCTNNPLRQKSPTTQTHNHRHRRHTRLCTCRDTGRAGPLMVKILGIRILPSGGGRERSRREYGYQPQHTPGAMSTQGMTAMVCAFHGVRCGGSFQSEACMPEIDR